MRMKIIESLKKKQGTNEKIKLGSNLKNLKTKSLN
jgi:hypothetical protein